jgi:hypothetical protein
MHFTKVVVNCEYGGEDYGFGEDTAVVVSSEMLDNEAFERAVEQSSLSDGKGEFVDFWVNSFESIDENKFNEMIRNLEDCERLYEIRFDENKAWVHQSFPVEGRFEVPPQWWNFK